MVKFSDSRLVLRQQRIKAQRSVLLQDAIDPAADLHSVTQDIPRNRQGFKTSPDLMLDLSQLMDLENYGIKKESTIIFTLPMRGRIANY